MFTRMIKLLVCIAALISLASCTTLTQNSLREITENEVNNCKLLGNVSGSDSIFIGLSAAVGTKNAKAKAMNQAVSMGATDVVWSQMGTSMTSEWVGKAYKCSSDQAQSDSNPKAVASPTASPTTAPTVAPPSTPARQTAQMSVLEAQKRLLELGYQPGSADGVMGGKTIDALKKFQQNKNLAVTGRMDYDTVEKLRR